MRRYHNETKAIYSKLFKKSIMKINRDVLLLKSGHLSSKADGYHQLLQVHKEYI